MSIPAIEGFTPFVPPTVTSPDATQVGGVGDAAASIGAADKSNGVDFASMLSDGLQRVEGLQDKASDLSVQAATGNLSNLHDYTIAATEASVATQLTTAVRNKALEAFNDIMRMQI